MYYPSSENKGDDQLRGYREADLRFCFRLCKLLVFPWGGSYEKVFGVIIIIFYAKSPREPKLVFKDTVLIHRFTFLINYPPKYDILIRYLSRWKLLKCHFVEQLN